MTSFEREETVIAKIEIKDSAGTYYDPATSVKVTITDASGTKKVDAQSMSPDAKGRYHYDWTSAIDDALGYYKVRYTITDGARVTISDDGFTVIV